MELTTASLALFIGGQLEVQNEQEGYLYRGEISDISVDDDTLRVKYAWLAKGTGYPPMPTGWAKDDKTEYTANLAVYTTGKIDDLPGGGKRLILQSVIIGEIVVFFSPGGSTLDPAKVKDLKYPTQT